jgi:hypothetical protein
VNFGEIFYMGKNCTFWLFAAFLCNTAEKKIGKKIFGLGKEKKWVHYDFCSGSVS